jgi:hypothetical protein
MSPAFKKLSSVADGNLRSQLRMPFSFLFVRGSPFTLELPDEETVGTAKRLIHSQYPTVIPDTLKLIFRSQILTDDQTFSSLNLSATDVILVQPRSMVPQSLPPFDPNPPPISLPTDTPPVLSPEVEQLMQMGFEKDDCVAALERARGKVERAIEYLLQGMSGPQPEPEPPQRDADFGSMFRHVGAVEQLRPLAPELDFESILEVLHQTNGDVEAAAAILREMNRGGQ